MRTQRIQTILAFFLAVCLVFIRKMVPLTDVCCTEFEVSGQIICSTKQIGDTSSKSFIKSRSTTHNFIFQLSALMASNMFYQLRAELWSTNCLHGNSNLLTKVQLHLETKKTCLPIGDSSQLDLVFYKHTELAMITILEFSLNGVELSLNSGNSENLRNH